MEYRFVIVKLSESSAQTSANEQVSSFAKEGFEVSGYSTGDGVFVVAMEKRTPLSDDEIAEQAKHMADRIKGALRQHGIDIDTISAMPMHRHQH